MVKRILRLLAAMLVVNGLLLSAQWLFLPVGGVRWIALEAGFVVGLFLLLPRKQWSWVVALGSAVVIVVLSFLSFSDAATRVILARPLNLYLDLPLASSVFDLLVGTLGSPFAIAVVVLAGLFLVGIIGLVTVLLRPDPTQGFIWFSRSSHGIDGPDWSADRVAGVALMAPLMVWLAGPYLTVVELPALPPRLGTPAVDLVRDQNIRLRETLIERDQFEADLARTPGDYPEIYGLLAKLEGRDVVLAFIESYGVSVVDDARYAPVVLPRLDDLGRRMDEAGLFVASGTLVAPTQGGQSWFSHGSLLSGLWLDNQLRYELLLASGRETLIDDFGRAGYRTVALMPAITFAWPEGRQFGYDEVYAWRDISYAGPPFNWVTMPDQFTWSFLEHSIRHRDAGVPDSALDERPLLLEVGLISSHAPWTPILPVLENWEDIGDGQVFSQWAEAGERPEELWLDSERVRDQFALSVDYAVNAMTAYAERYVDDDILLIAMGDHQPAPLITGDGASWEVPVHVISGDPELVRPFLEWGFAPGGVPSREHPERGMDAFRDWFVNAFSAESASPDSGPCAQEACARRNEGTK